MQFLDSLSLVRNQYFKEGLKYKINFRNDYNARISVLVPPYVQGRILWPQRPPSPTPFPLLFIIPSYITIYTNNSPSPHALPAL